MENFDNKYTNDYFIGRNLNDLNRNECFYSESKFLKKYTDLNGIVCDVGCSTGEFLSSIGWAGDKYGMEVNDFAIQMAEERSINFSKNILNVDEFFDLVIFRGTIQHLPSPFEYISRAYDALKPGGLIVFLATPNANSLCYKLFNTVPALDDKLNFYIPSDISLSNILNNIGFRVLEIERPYFNSPYANLLKDHLMFFSRFIFKRKKFNNKFPFWGNMMNLIAVKA